jgi:hypothetical protein
MTKRDCDVLAGESLGRLPGACGNEIEPAKTKEQRPETRSKFINRWGVVLAGGDGLRLKPLTQFICGDERPKQFCPLLGDYY